MRNPVRAVLHAHAPVSLRHVRSEHVVMASAYGSAAPLGHSTVGAVLIMIGYLLVAAFAVWDQRREERRDACTGRHAAGCPLRGDS
jgi:hypothetical protein